MNWWIDCERSAQIETGNLTVYLYEYSSTKYGTVAINQGSSVATIVY